MSTRAQQQLLIVTGMSGAGLSTAANALEDLEWYVVENLPPQLITTLFDLSQRGDLPRIATVVDVRGSRNGDDLLAVVNALQDDPTVGVLFLEASDEVLVKRFEQVRRPHPLQGDGTLLDGIEAERARTRELRAAADWVIDTSDLNIHQLGQKIAEQYRSAGQPVLRVTLQSFGFKYGTPSDADMVFDARFLANPYWDESLRGLTGRDAAVAEFVFQQPGATEFLDRIVALLEPVVAGYQRERKHHVTIAIGCTGGKHRSVALIEALAGRMATLDGLGVAAQHRDLGRE